jgi:hypothetical protein
MNSWYTVTMPSKEGGINGKGFRLQQAFMGIYVTNHAPKDAAMFMTDSADYKEVHYFFSPSAAKLAGNLIETYGGVECPIPFQGENVSLLVGESTVAFNLLATPAKER